MTIVGVFIALALSVAFALTQAARPVAPLLEPTGPTHLFQDPRGRYSLSIPVGWKITMTGDDPTFHDGASWVRVCLVVAVSASAAVDQASALFRPQFTAFNTINRGNTVIGGRPSHGLNVDGMNAAGRRMSVLLTAQPAGPGRRYFVLVSATPVAQAPQLNTSVMALANSVRFGGN
jgi:hypothetical protein